MSQDVLKEEPIKHFERIEELLRNIQYGNVVITVQDGRIVQIDKTEKYRIRN